MDPKTGKVRLRYVDIESEMYQTLHAYMIRLEREDFERPESVSTLAKAANLSDAEFIARFGPSVGYSPGAAQTSPSPDKAG
jgi:6-phosphofructokinase 1